MLKKHWVEIIKELLLWTYKSFENFNYVLLQRGKIILFIIYWIVPVFCLLFFPSYIYVIFLTWWFLFTAFSLFEVGSIIRFRRLIFFVCCRALRKIFALGLNCRLFLLLSFSLSIFCTNRVACWVGWAVVRGGHSLT
jgi:hypothetical protein